MRTDGAIACWGSYWAGQTLAPNETLSLPSAGELHTCAIQPNGSVDCWGDNSSGQAEPPSGTFTQVGTGRQHSCGLRSDEQIVCWGDDWLEKSYPPVGAFTQVSVDGDHSCGLRADGAIECWGGGRRSGGSPPSGTFAQVSAGWVHVCGLKTDGTLACEGRPETSSPPSGSFAQVSAGGAFAGGYFACALDRDGEISCWGDNKNGETDLPSGRFTQVEAGANMPARSVPTAGSSVGVRTGSARPTRRAANLRNSAPVGSIPVRFVWTAQLTAGAGTCSADSPVFGQGTTPMYLPRHPPSPPMTSLKKRPASTTALCRKRLLKVESLRDC